MYANHRHYILFIIAFITFVVTALGYAYVRQRVYHQAVRSSDLLEQVSEMEKKKQRDEDLTSFSSKLSEDQKKINSYIVSKETAVDFIEMIEKIGRDTSTEFLISGISTKEIVKTNKVSDNFTYLNAHVETRGTWTNVMRALILIENMPYSMSINNIRLSVENLDEETKPVATSTKISAREKSWRLSLDVKVLSLD